MKTTTENLISAAEMVRYSLRQSHYSVAEKEKMVTLLTLMEKWIKEKQNYE